MIATLWVRHWIRVPRRRVGPSDQSVTVPLTTSLLRSRSGYETAPHPLLGHDPAPLDRPGGPTHPPSASRNPDLPTAPPPHVDSRGTWASTSCSSRHQAKCLAKFEQEFGRTSSRSRLPTSVRRSESTRARPQCHSRGSSGSAGSRDSGVSYGGINSAALVTFVPDRA
jgi:hypothetical protein